MSEIRELTEQDFARTLPAHVRKRIARGESESGDDIAALRRSRHHRSGIVGPFAGGAPPLLLLALLLMSIPLILAAQDRTPRQPQISGRNPTYTGRFVFTRIRYGPPQGALGFRWRGATWRHDYPRADWHLSQLLRELTTIPVELEGTNVYVLDDPELFRHPVAYISEPGFWTMSDAEARRLREYVLKGGFLIFDDFENEQWDNLQAQLQRVLPEYDPILLDIRHPIFHSFFQMQEIYFPHPLVNVTPSYYGLFEDNDPRKRMLAIINYNNDIAEYWEWSETGWWPVDTTNEAYKLGVNYIMYALTH